MSKRDNQMADMLKRIHNRSKKDNKDYLRSSKASSQPSQAVPDSLLSTSKTSSHMSSKSRQSTEPKRSTHMISWSVMLDYRTIAIINALEKLYNCKNRDEVIHMLFHYNLKHLINVKGQSGKEHFELYRKVYLLTTKGKAMKRYRKFYQK